MLTAVVNYIIILQFIGFGHCQDYSWKFSTNSTHSMARRIINKILSVEQAEGVGARVRRSVGRPEVRKPCSDVSDGGITKNVMIGTVDVCGSACCE